MCLASTDLSTDVLFHATQARREVTRPSIRSNTVVVDKPERQDGIEQLHTNIHVNHHQSHNHSVTALLLRIIPLGSRNALPLRDGSTEAVCAIVVVTAESRSKATAVDVRACIHVCQSA